MKYSTAIVDFFEKVLNEKKCYELARQHNFIVRSSSKLKGYEFIKALVVPSEGLSTDSLKGLCLRMREFNSDAELSAQALCERINDKSSKELMKSVYGTILSHMRSSITIRHANLKTLETFNSVLLEDSTVVELDEKLQGIFPGTNRGGKGAKSQVKIDVIYDLLKGVIVNADLYCGNEPDQSLAERIIRWVKPGDLIIRDLGYFVLRVFISRLVPRKFYRDVALNRLEYFLKEMAKDIRRMLLKDKRKRKTMRGRVAALEGYYNQQPSEFQKVA